MTDISALQQANTEVQTRSEKNGINIYPKVVDAIKATESDSTIWKISFNTSGGERIRLTKSDEYQGCWIYDPLMEDL